MWVDGDWDAFRMRFICAGKVSDVLGMMITTESEKRQGVREDGKLYTQSWTVGDAAPVKVVELSGCQEHHHGNPCEIGSHFDCEIRTVGASTLVSARTCSLFLIVRGTVKTGGCAGAAKDICGKQLANAPRSRRGKTPRCCGHEGEMKAAFSLHGVLGRHPIPIEIHWRD